MGAHSKNSFQALCSEHAAARVRALSVPLRPQAEPRTLLSSPRCPLMLPLYLAPSAVYFIIYATAQGIMDAYEEAIEQVRERSRHTSAARAAPRPLSAVADRH
jgi:hypothetical protein